MAFRPLTRVQKALQWESGNERIGEEAMKCKSVSWAVLITLAGAMAVKEKWLSSETWSAQAAEGRRLPTFEGDRPPVIVFDAAGNYIKAWGGAGNGYEWPEREHGIHIDYKGFVWLGGNSCPTNGLPGLKPVADDQLLKFTQAGRLVMQIGHSNQSKGNADTRNVHRAADAWVYQPSNELFVADGYGNHRVIVFDADTGKFK